MHVIVAGGSGFIGRHLIPVLLAHGHTVTVLTRAQVSNKRTFEGLLSYVHWNPSDTEHGVERTVASVLSGADAIINIDKVVESA